MINTAPDLTQICAAISASPKSGKRRLIAVAGAPASGKSTIAEQIADQLCATGHKAQVVPMDGFHLDNAELDKMDLRARKGAPETFDIDALTVLIARIQDAPQVSYPIFDRAADRAIPAGGTLCPDVETVVVEGNYLLFDAQGWRDLHGLWDFRIFLDVPEPVLRARLVDRWLAHDHTQLQAEARADGNDMANARRIYAQRLPCDLEVTLP